MPKQQESNPKVVTVRGRLSFPSWTAQEAYDRSQSGQYPAKSVAEAKPEFSLVLEQPQVDKFVSKIVDEFFPYCLQQFEKDEKKDRLDASEIAELTKQVQKHDGEGVYNTPFKKVSDKTLELAPEAAGVIKIIGPTGGNFELKAVAWDESQLDPVDPDILKFPVIKPINETVHQMYPGCYVAVTINLYAYHNGKLPGFSAGATVAVFREDGERFGGGVSVDEDEMFMD